MRLLVAVLAITCIGAGCDRRIAVAPATAPDSAPNAGPASSEPSAAGAPDTSTAVDNTGINVRDRNPQSLTPFDQGQSQADVSTTAEIRQRILAEDISLDAQNVKIITRDGQVTLRGPVASDAERALIQRIAQDIAGEDRVTNQVDVDRKQQP